MNRFGYELRRMQAAEGTVLAENQDEAIIKIKELIGDDDIDWDTDHPEVDAFDFGPDE